MVKVENLSQGVFHLKFRNLRSGEYTKPLRPGARITLTDQEYSDWANKNDTLLRVTCYNITGKTKQVTYTLVNETIARIPVKFVRSPIDSYTKMIAPNRTLTVSQEEFDLIRDMPSSLTVLSGKNSQPFFHAKKKNIEKNAQEDEINALLDKQEETFGERNPVPANAVVGAPPVEEVNVQEDQEESIAALLDNQDAANGIETVVDPEVPETLTTEVKEEAVEESTGSEEQDTLDEVESSDAADSDEGSEESESSEESEQDADAGEEQDSDSEEQESSEESDQADINVEKPAQHQHQNHNKKKNKNKNKNRR